MKMFSGSGWLGSDNVVIEYEISGCDWLLLRNLGRGLYFFIWNRNGCSLVPQIALYDMSKNYFRCRSVAIKMFKCFVEGLEQEQGKGAGERGTSSPDE